jgi:cell division protein FtsI (penicillin-binding protein 3)
MLNRKPKREEKKLWDEDITKIRLKQSKKKALILCTVILFCFSVIVIRLVGLMVFDHETLTQKADRQYLGIKTLTPQRGVIWDREMRPLSVNIETESLYAVPSKINDIERLSYNLAPIIKVSEKRLSTKLMEKKDKSFIWVGRRLDENTVQKINSLQQKLGLQEELGFLAETKRQYPNGQLASHILGFTNIDNEGIDGIELRYNKEISGSIKKVYHNRDAKGNSLLDDIEESTPGNNLMLTIDEGLQHIVEMEIENAMGAWQAEAVVAIMMEPSTGKILAMANRPTYDPNSVGKVQADERRNRAITDNYEPGSTFKTFVASAAIEEKIVSLNEKFDVSRGFIKVPGGIIRDAHRHGVLTFKEVIQKSSNVGASQIALRLGKERFYNYIKKFGFGEKTGIDLPGEAKGFIRKTEKWSGRSLPSISIGQEISVTPLQLLRAYSVIANGGKLMKPYIVSNIISPSGEIIKSFSPEVEKQVISENTAKTMRDILKTVVEEGGTAQKASVMGNMVAGKTGTAQMVDPKTGLYSKNDYASSFVGFTPADNPKIALIVVVFKPRGASYGGTVAAPVFKNIAEQAFVYLNEPMENEENSVLLVSNHR